MKNLFLFFLFMNGLIACNQEAKGSVEKKALLAQKQLNVSYGTDSLQTMDIYLPANRSVGTTPTLILIHGGGWTSGSKADFVTYIDSFKTRLPQYAIFNINYRLATGGHLFPAQENDVKAAVDFIVKMAATYSINEKKLSLLGFSAGAHLALLQAYKYPVTKIKSVIDYFGPTDLVSMYNKPWHPLVPVALQLITGTSPEMNKEMYERSSPVYFISSQSPPTLILHGQKDVVVAPSQSELLADKLHKAGVRHQLHLYPSAGHGRWYGSTLATSLDQLENFLQ